MYQIIGFSSSAEPVEPCRMPVVIAVAAKIPFS
jgi:hypothetical protein